MNNDTIEWPENQDKLFAYASKAVKPVRVLIYFLGGITYAEIAAVR